MNYLNRGSQQSICLTQSQLAEIYKTSRENITMHILNIYKENELPKDSTCKKFLQVQNEGSRSVKRNIDHYNLDMINTAAELIYDRVDNEKLYVGMTNFKGDYVTIDDVKIAKNYLSEIQLQRLNLLVSQFLDFTELQALEQRTMKMQEWVEELDNKIVLNIKKN